MTLTKQKPRRTTATHRKRVGQHRQRTDHFAKAYWPYIPIFAVLLLGIFFNSLMARQNHNVLGYATNISPIALLAETNGIRTNDHESALELNAQLTDAAQAKANDMAKRNYWSHVTPDGRQPWSFVSTAGYQYEAAGENLAYGFGTSDQVITAWMHSTEHRDNILKAVYQDVGFATANVESYQGTGPQTIVVAIYGTPIGIINPDTNSTKVPPVVLGNQTQTVSRLELLSNSGTIALTLAALCGAALAVFFMRHALAWRRVLVKGEQFALHHPFYDMLLMGLSVFAILLSNAAGSIL